MTTRWTIMKDRVSVYGQKHERRRFVLCAEAPNGSFPAVATYTRQPSAHDEGVRLFGAENKVAPSVAFADK